MKTLITFVMYLLLWIGLTQTGVAQYDTTLDYQFNGTFTIPDLPDYSTYTIGKKNGGQFILKPSNYQLGNVSWSTPSCGGPTIDSVTSCGPGYYNLTYLRSDNVWIGLYIYIRYYVDIVDSTPSSATYGEMPDTVWINPGDSAILSVGTEFADTRWYKMDQTSVLSYGYSISISDSGRYRIRCIDGSGSNYLSYDTIVVATLCTNILTTQSPTLCQGFSITVGSNTYNATGTYTDTLQTVNGCDSIVTTNLTINQPTSSSQTLTECAGFSITVGSNTYTTTGIYTDVLVGSNGCDSTVTTDLTINQPSSSTASTSICQGDSAYAGGQWQTASGTYYDTLSNVSGCDSIIITNLTVNQPASNSQSFTECAGFSVTVGSNTYTTTGTYTDTLQTVNGCDSVVSTILTVNPLPTVDLGSDTVITSQGDTTTLVAIANNAGTYLWSTGDTAQSIVADSTGWYFITVTNPCGNVVDSVYLDVVTSISHLPFIVQHSVQVCPNPAVDFIQILGYTDGFTKVEIFSQDGRRMMQIVDKSQLKAINVSMLSPGMYYLKIDTFNGPAKPIKFVKT